MCGIGADLEKICGSRHQLRTSLAVPSIGRILAVGKGAESGSPCKNILSSFGKGDSKVRR